MIYVKVWCEYDFSGSFGWDNNEEVFIFEEGVDNIAESVFTYLKKMTRLDEEELEDNWGWEFITPVRL